MIDDATGRWFARFVAQRLDGGKHEPAGALREKAWAATGLLHRQSEPVSDRGENQTGRSRAGKDRSELPPTQIGRALQELAIPWIPAHSPQAKGRVERGFLTAQDRLVKGMRVAGVTTLEQANHYLETEFLPWVNARWRWRRPVRTTPTGRWRSSTIWRRFSAMWKAAG
jgi:hypothetical protein